MASPIKIFSGGMNKDKNPLNQPEGTYVDALDIIQCSQDGDSYSIVNEKGTSAILQLTKGMSVIGHCILDDDIILFLTDTISGDGEIGVVDTNTNIYTPILNDMFSGHPAGTYVGYNFSIDRQIEAVAKIRFDGHRVVYFTDDFNPPRLFDLDDPPITSELSDDLALNPRFDIPIVSNFSFNQNTSLTTTAGTYMFVARYADANLTPTMFGMISNPIPVVNEMIVGNMTSAWKNYDGAVFGQICNKTINIEIKNIDQSLPYIEIAVLSFPNEDLRSSPVVRIFERTAITADVMTFEYDDSKIVEPAIDLTVEEVLSQGNGYIRAKCIEQKDNRLFLGNLASNVDLDFQSIANDVKVSYYIKDVNASPSQYGDQSTVPLTDYRGEQQTFNTKTYTRDEVYDFAIVFIYKSGNYSFAFHIPAPAASSTTPGKYPNTSWPVDNTTSSLYTNTTPIELGTYISSETYPLGAGYPSGPQRFHLMPSLRNEPSNKIQSGKQVVRVIGLEFSNVIIPPDVRSKVRGYIIVRQPRNKIRNKSIASQGIMVDSTKMGDGKSVHTLNDDNEYNYSGCGHYQPSCLFGHTNVGNVAGHGVWWNDGMQQGFLPKEKSLITFYSPETAFRRLSSDSSDYSVRLDVNSFDSIQAVQEIHTRSAVQMNDRQNCYAVDDKGPEGCYGWHHWLGNFDGHTYLPEQQIQGIDGKQWLADMGGASGTKLSDMPGMSGISGSLASSGMRFSNYGNFEALLLHLADNKDINYPNYGGRTLEWGAGNASGDFGKPFYLNPKTDETGWETEHNNNKRKRYLYNLLNTSDSLYGKVTDGEYVYVGHTLSSSDTSLLCKGGDTFISRIALRNWTNIGFIQYRSNAHTLKLGFPGWSSYASPLNLLRSSSSLTPRGHEFRAISYFYVESTINADYRHTSRTSYGEYYPKSNNKNSVATHCGAISSSSNSLYDADPKFDDINGYNFLYSRENSARLFYSKPLAFKQVGDFPTRIAFSELAIIGEQQDNYKSFPVLNFHDLPKHTGEINKLFVLNNILYGHTAKSLWRCFVNDVALVQSTLDTNLVLGTGGLFEQPSKEISTIDGGYAGTTSQWAHIGTPYGRFFVDLNQKKVFLFSDKLQEISYNGLWKYFLDNMEITDIDVSDADNKDNPANPANGGYLSGYDYRNKRFILTKKTKATITGKRSGYSQPIPPSDSFKPFASYGDMSTRKPMPAGIVQVVFTGYTTVLNSLVGQESIVLCYYDKVLSKEVCEEYLIYEVTGNHLWVYEYPKSSYVAKVDCWEGNYDKGLEQASGWTWENWVPLNVSGCKQLRGNLTYPEGTIRSPEVLVDGQTYHLEVWINTQDSSGYIGGTIDVKGGIQGMSLMAPLMTPINNDYGYYQDTTFTHQGGNNRIRIIPSGNLSEPRILGIRCTNITKVGLAARVDKDDEIKIQGVGKSEGGFTVSYSPVSNSWMSFHSWKPNVIISKGDRFFSVHNGEMMGEYKLWEHGKGKYGDFYSNFVGISESNILFVINADPSVTKVFDNLILHTQSLDEDTEVYQLNDTFNSVQLYNEYQNTGEVLLNGNIKHKEDKYCMAVPRDRVVDVALNIFDPSKLYTTKAFRQRMRSKYVFVKFIYNNQNDFRLIMNAINTIFRKSYR